MIAIRITKQTRVLAEIMAGHPIPQRQKDNFIVRHEDGSVRFMTQIEFDAFAIVNDIAPFDTPLWMK